MQLVLRYVFPELGYVIKEKCALGEGYAGRAENMLDEALGVAIYVEEVQTSQILHKLWRNKLGKLHRPLERNFVSGTKL